MLDINAVECHPHYPIFVRYSKSAISRHGMLKTGEDLITWKDAFLISRSQQ